MNSDTDAELADQAAGLFAEPVGEAGEEENTKYALVGPSDEQYEQLYEILKNRLDDGIGECVYEVCYFLIIFKDLCKMVG